MNPTPSVPCGTATDDCSIQAPLLPPACRSSAATHSRIDHNDWRVTEANRRLPLVEAYNELIKDGTQRKEAAELIGQPRNTLDRWHERWRESGFEGLLPRTNNSGRKSVLEKLGLSDQQLRDIIQECQGSNLDLESTAATLRSFAHSDRCPEQLADIILDPRRSSKHALPPSLRRAVSINQNLSKAHRGPRTLALRGMSIPRKLDILPGDVFSSDDTTAIWGAWVPWIESEDYPFGVKLLQVQHLPVIDVASQAVLTYALIVREKSSYRACDIWALFGHTFDQVGLPRLGMQLERGSWEANLIAGEQVEYDEGEPTHAMRVGGLRMLPANITDWHRERMGEAADHLKNLQTFTSYLPKSKSVEAFINRSQTFEGTLWGCLGRDQMRAPFEKMKRQFQRCSRPRAKEDPRNHFLSLTEIAARLNHIYDFLNTEPMEGEVFSGIPRQKFDLAVRERPLWRLQDEQRWLYARDWKRLRITQGWARIRLTHQVTSERFSHWYVNPEIFAEIEGADVVIYYDREQFEQPAQVIAAQRLTIRGQEYRPGDWICRADHFQRPGMFLDGDRNGHDIARAWRNAVMTIYGTIARHAPSRQLPEEIQARRAAAPVQTADSRPSTESTAPIRSRAPRLVATPEEFNRQSNRLARMAERARALDHSTT